MVLTLTGYRGPSSNKTAIASPAADAREVAIGERLFLETRVAQFFAVQSGGDTNIFLGAGDPVVKTTQTQADPLPGPLEKLSCLPSCR